MLDFQLAKLLIVSLSVSDHCLGGRKEDFPPSAMMTWGLYSALSDLVVYRSKGSEV